MEIENITDDPPEEAIKRSFYELSQILQFKQCASESAKSEYSRRLELFQDLSNQLDSINANKFYLEGLTQEAENRINEHETIEKELKEETAQLVNVLSQLKKKESEENHLTEQEAHSFGLDVLALSDQMCAQKDFYARHVLQNELRALQHENRMIERELEDIRRKVLDINLKYCAVADSKSCEMLNTQIRDLECHVTKDICREKSKNEQKIKKLKELEKSKLTLTETIARMNWAPTLEN